jgi:glycosyltransferase involved in cell wall biosynthesis
MHKEKPRRLLHVTSTLEDHGYVHLIWHFSRLVDPSKYQVVICCMYKGGPYLEKFRELGIEVKNLDMRSYFDLRVVPKLVRFIKEKNIDLVHTHIRLADWYGRICARLAKVPFIFTTVHNTDYWRKGGKYWIYALLDKWTMTFCTQIIAVSQGVKDFLQEWQKFNADKITVILNGSVREKYSDSQGSKALKKALSLDDGRLILGVTARLVRQKALHDLLYATREILKQRKDVRVLIVGEGPLEKQLKSLTEELQIMENVVFLGFRTDVPAILGMLDIFVMPSAYEGLGLSIVEAMMAGKPVVGTRVSGIEELIVDQRTGILVPPGDPRALAEALLLLMESPQKREEMGQEGKKRAFEFFTIERMTEDLISFYDDYT